MKRNLFTVLLFAAVALTFGVASAQSPTPVAAAVQTPAPETKSDSTQATMKSLQELKEANDQILKQQQATLEALDELQKAAEQIKIFSKRG